jgi:flagellar biosynthetic protein FliS
MMYGRATRAYKKIDLEGAPKVEILDRLYSRLLRDFDEARAAMARRDVHARAAACDHALRIVTELIAALDPKAGSPDLCVNLEALYRFVIDRITSAGVTSDSGPLGEASTVIVELQSAFRQAGDRA